MRKFRKIAIPAYDGRYFDRNGLLKHRRIFIILTTAVTLSSHGITDIRTSAQAASSMRPVAGNFSFFVCSASITWTGLPTVPCPAAAYALSRAFQWKNSLEYKPEAAKGFYAVIAVSTLLGIVLCFAPIDPIKALYWSAVINGVISVSIMCVTMLMAGKFVIGIMLKVLGWGCTAITTIAVGAMFLTYTT
jgi:hypothetical protein